MSDTPRTIYRKDYTQPNHWVETVELRFELGEESTRVHSRLTLRRNEAVPPGPLVLDGQDLELVSLSVDGTLLEPSAYQVDADRLTVDGLPDAFTLELTTRIRPQDNTTLEGLYKSGGLFCTQCEAEGFRKITYYPDRPDVMARFTTTVVAEKARYPVLLSNGNLIAERDLGDGLHEATWEDPFPKPCYLFALVAGDLSCIRDRHVTPSGREIDLRIYVEAHNADRCGHAMRSLKNAMAWDEKVFGLECDLDTYMIVAVDDFNMGAMENKGLNIFNSKYVLARPDTATDTDFQNIEGVIGHEYFHNWTGNRVTCRDWFQLSLKEGLTVFRDQEFSSDMGSRAVKRIADVRALRALQFPEDAGPMAHPVRPDSYIEINNFYTMTVYEKGAEVVRMIHTLLGAEGFRRGMDLYFQRHDGQAVTCDDFVAAMEDANGADLGQFRLWYSQAGTPRLEARGHYDADERSYTLTLKQTIPDTPGQTDKKPQHIPVAVGLLDRQGRDLPLHLDGEAVPGTTAILHLREAEQSFRFTGIGEEPVPSILRGFSAPVRLRADGGDERLRFLLAHDSDPFNRWEAGQNLAVSTLLRLVDDHMAGRDPRLEGSFVAAFAAVMDDDAIDQALLAEILTLPSEGYLGEQMDVIRVDEIHTAREFVLRTLAAELRDRFESLYQRGRGGEYRIDAQSIARRRLTNLCLDYLVRLDDPSLRQLALEQYLRADNMTDAMAAMTALSRLDCDERDQVLADFQRRWKDDPLVLDKWFSVQATSPGPGALDRVRELMDHPSFDLRNPNRFRALIGAFAHGNPVAFHAADGSGYRFIADQVLALDPLNPQVAARLAGAFTRWRRHDEHRQALMRAELERMAARRDLSRDVYEIVSKSLA
jgi:aminopeptidase N